MNSLDIIGRYLILMRKVFTKPEKWSIFRKQVFIESNKLIINSVPLVMLISVFIGGVIVLQSAYNLESSFIPKMYIGYMARESILLEFSSTMICLILAGKIGSNISSEIGSMRITEQIDAMDIMGVNSANYLILPKIVAASTLTPLLMLLSFIVGLIGGYLIVATTNLISISDYLSGIRYYFIPYYVFYSMLKSSIFSFLITSLSSFYGYYAVGGSLGVGKSSTEAIVITSALILIFNLIITKLMLG